MVTNNVKDWLRKTFRRKKIEPVNGLTKPPNLLRRLMNVTKKNKVHSEKNIFQITSESQLPPSESQLPPSEYYQTELRPPSNGMITGEIAEASKHSGQGAFRTELLSPPQAKLASDFRKTIQILVVDDLPLNLRIIQQNIRSQMKKMQKYEGVKIDFILANSCGDAMEKFEKHPNLNIVLLDFDLGTSSNCDDKQYHCCNDGKTYPTYFDNNGATHSKHNGIELAKQLYEQGYNNTIALQTSFHDSVTHDEEQTKINRFLDLYELGKGIPGTSDGVENRPKLEITFVNKGTEMFQNLVPLLDKELQKISVSGGKKHRKRKYQKTKRVRHYSMKKSKSLTRGG